MIDASYTQVNPDRYADYPEPDIEPPALVPSFAPAADTQYLSRLDEFIRRISSHVRHMQDQDIGKKMHRFSSALENRQGVVREDEDATARQNHEAMMKSVWKRRRAYRQMAKDAMDERQKFIESWALQEREEQVLRKKINRLPLIDFKRKESREKAVFDLFSVVFVMLQLVLTLVYVVSTGYRNDALGNDGYYVIAAPLRADDLYSYFIHIMFMVVFGFGYLTVFLKKYGFSAVGYNFLLTVFTLEVAILTQLVWRNIAANPSSAWITADLTIAHLVDAAYVAATISVSWGVLAGKMSVVESMIFVILEAFIYGLNYYINIFLLKGVDPGGAMTIHLFGTYFGLMTSFWVSKPFNANDLRPYVEEENNSTYHGEFLSLVATVFLWVFFPSFNAAAAPDGTQHRVIVNTVSALIGSCVFAFFASRTLRRRHFHIRDIQNATLAGGVVMASAHSLIITPGAAILIGCIIGTVSVLTIMLFQPWFERKFPLKAYDTRGSHSAHGIPGIIGGIASCIACGVNQTKVYGQPAGEVYPRGLPNQGGYQAGVLFISLGISLTGGFFVGLFLWIVRRLTRRTFAKPFLDEYEWHVTADYPRSFATGGIPEP